MVVNDSVAARGPDGVVAMEGDCESLPVVVNDSVAARGPDGVVVMEGDGGWEPRRPSRQ